MWFRVDDSFYDHPKAVGISNDALATWARAGGWCGRHLTDGVLADPNMFTGDAAVPRAVIDDLIDRNLWEPTTEGQRGPLQFHDWADWNPTRAQVLADRKAAAERRRRYLARARGAIGHAVTDGVTDGVTDAVTDAVTDTVTARETTAYRHAYPDPTRPEGEGGSAQIGDQSSRRNARAAPDGSSIELIRLTQALMRSATGQQVAAEDAADICTAVLSGRDVADPAGYLRTTLGDKRRARALLPASANPTPTPPATTALCRRCSRPGHDAEHCPTLTPGTTARPADATPAADAARKELANRQRTLDAPEHDPAPGLHGQALARAQAAQARAERGPDPAPHHDDGDHWPADDGWPDAADTADDEPADDGAADQATADDDDADIPF